MRPLALTLYALLGPIGFVLGWMYAKRARHLRNVDGEIDVVGTRGRVRIHFDPVGFSVTLPAAEAAAFSTLVAKAADRASGDKS